MKHTKNYNEKPIHNSPSTTPLHSQHHHLDQFTNLMSSSVFLIPYIKTKLFNLIYLQALVQLTNILFYYFVFTNIFCWLFLVILLCGNNVTIPFTISLIRITNLALVYYVSSIQWNEIELNSMKIYWFQSYSHVKESSAFYTQFYCNLLLKLLKVYHPIFNHIY